MTSTSSPAKLFQPIQIGDITLNHRIALAPMTRFRANKSHVHGDSAVEYYSQRASTPGTLLLTEATIIATKAGGMSNVPGIWNEEQIRAWKKVSDAVHAKKSFIFMQLWALGRTADPSILRSSNPSYDLVSSSSVRIRDRKESPRPLTVREIQEYVQLYAQAASNAVHGAGCDGVEIHAGSGYLVDQFLQDACNERTDEYGGSLDGRCRFALEIVGAVVDKIGTKRTGIRMTPWSEFEDMRKDNQDPRPTFSHLVTRLRDLFPDLGYIHVVEPRIPSIPDEAEPESNDFLREIWKPRPFISAGHPDANEVIQIAEEKGDIVAVGRYFTSNPDLPLRIRHGHELAPYIRETFYTPETHVGYSDHPFADIPALHHD